MTCSSQIWRTNPLIFTITLLLYSSCAYFNTFYNAEEYFEKAEKQRLEKAGESIPPGAIDAYGKVIDKSQYVIDNYPESKYVDDALMLIGKSRFYRNEYRLAESIFKQYSDTYEDGRMEAQYWQALCKWKLGKPQPALETLRSMLDSPKDDFHSSIYLSIAEIHLGNDEHELALENLVSAAEINRDRDERGQIYYRIADLAYEKENYEQALIANEEVVKNSTSKKRKEESNLQIVKIHRLMGNWGKVKNLIKDMLIEDTYKSIHGDLELELVKLYQMDDQLNEAITRLESIKEEYKNTKTSAEAYYIHGEISLYDQWNLIDAKKYFGQVTREFRKSIYTSTSNLRVKEITKYLESVEALDELLIASDELNTHLDTLASDSLIAIAEIEIENVSTEIADHLYNKGELEAFHFKRQDSSMVLFQEIISDHTESQFYPKSLFVLYYIHSQNGRHDEAKIYSDRIMEELPSSEYSDYLRKTLDLPVDEGSVQAILRRGELEWLVNPENALPIYKSIIEKDAQSETAVRAAYFLAHHYDYTYFSADSAIKYYTWIHDSHGESEQAIVSKSRFEMLQQAANESEVARDGD